MNVLFIFSKNAHLLDLINKSENVTRVRLRKNAREYVCVAILKHLNLEICQKWNEFKK